MSKHQIVNKARISISKFFGSKINQTFVSSSFSSALRSVLEYVPKNANFLILEEDYPSILNALKERSFNYHKIPITADLEHNIEKLIEEKKISVIALSVVQWISGLLIDIEFLKKIKIKFPDIIIMGDGTQFLGGHLFNFQDSPFDFIAASGYKWLVSGFGNGLFMISNDFFDFAKINESILLEKIFDGHSDLLGIESLNYSIQKFLLIMVLLLNKGEGLKLSLQER